MLLGEERRGRERRGGEKDTFIPVVPGFLVGYITSFLYLFQVYFIKAARAIFNIKALADALVFLVLFERILNIVTATSAGPPLRDVSIQWMYIGTKFAYEQSTIQCWHGSTGSV